MRLLLFNPENDLALAADERNFTPPAGALRLHEAGALLPALWAREGDIIVAPESERGVLEELRRRFGVYGAIATPELAAQATEALPWGWSLDAARQLRAAGAPESIIPSDGQLSQWRRLSHRATSVDINRRVAELCPSIPLPPEAVVTDSADEVVALCQADPRSYVKSPWSSSGRGVFCAEAMDCAQLRRQAEGIIRRQGSVIVEHGLDNLLDFALLFDLRNGAVAGRAYSVFHTFKRAAYGGNIVAPQGYLRSMVADVAGERFLSLVEEAVTVAVGEIIAPCYSGPIGVDMMVCRYRGQLMIAPCIEVNLRMTMGMTALALSRLPSVSARTPLDFTVTYAPDGRVPASAIAVIPPRQGFAFTLSAT